MEKQEKTISREASVINLVRRSKSLSFGLVIGDPLIVVAIANAQVPCMSLVR